MNFTLASQAKHDSDVRGVSAVPSLDGTFLAASRDKSVGLWMTSNSGICENLNRFSYHEHFVSAAKYHSGFDAVDGTPCILSVSHDKHVLACSLESGQLEAVMDGHDMQVSCIAIGPAGQVVTGSWDSSLIIWRRGEVGSRLKGHANSVLCVCVLSDTGDILSGSGDKTIIRWDMSGKRLATYTHHTDSVQTIAEIADIGFVSAGNDAKIIMCALDGTVLSTLVGHDSFVYSVCVLPSGEIASTSEDRTLKVWRQTDCVQTVYHPTTVWSVCALGNGDIVTGCADGFARVFTRSEERMAPPAIQETFQVAVSSAQISTKTMSNQLDPSRIEAKESLSKPGHTEGQMKFIRAEYGNGVEVYSWSEFTRSWTKIGDVADGNDSGPAQPQKSLYKGKEYDYVFDIDFNGQQSLKLPYNEGDNPWTTASNFIVENQHLGISALDKEAIVKWIFQHTKAGANPSLTNPNAPKAPTVAPTPSQQPQKNSGSAPAGLKVYAITNFDGIAKKLRELEAPDTTPLTTCLQQSQELTPAALEALQNLLKRLKPGDRFPAIDLIRHAAMFSNNEVFQTTYGPAVSSLLDRTANPVEEMLCLRAATNFMTSTNTANPAVKACVQPFESLGALEALYGPIRRALKAPNREALVFLCFNVARWCTISNAPTCTAVAANLVSFLGEVLLHEQETATKMVALQALKLLYTSPATKSAAIDRSELALTYGCVHTNTLYGDPELISLATEVMSFLKKPEI